MTAPHTVTTNKTSIESWTTALAEPVGAPGGGAATGVMLALAASLTSMVGGYTKAGEEGSQREIDDLRDRAQLLRRDALRLADEDAASSSAFGAAFRLPPGEEREAAIRVASLDAARASAKLGDHAVAAIDDLAWLARHGNRALIADVVVALGALRAAISGARTNVSFDLASLRSSGSDLEQIREQHPVLWAKAQQFDAALERIDALSLDVDARAAPTDHS